MAAPPFSVRQRNGAPRGYSVELCEKVAGAIGKAVGLPGLKVVWRAVDGETRISDVASRKIDAECGTTTITLSRMERVDFSLPIFVDGGSALVRAGSGLAHGGGPQRQADRRDAGDDDGSRAEAHARVDRRQRVARAGQGRRGRLGRAPVPARPTPTRRTGCC